MRPPAAGKRRPRTTIAIRAGLRRRRPANGAARVQGEEGTMISSIRWPAFAALVLFVVGASADEAWIGSWGASPQPPTPGGGPFPATPSFENRTIRQIVRVSVGGSRLRLRITNEYGTAPLVVGAARVAIADGEGRPIADTERVVTFGGEVSAVVPAGAPWLSDPIDLRVDDLALLSVSLYFPESTGACTCHATGMQAAFVSEPGDH